MASHPFTQQAFVTQSFFCLQPENGCKQVPNNLRREELPWLDPNPSGREGDREGEVQAKQSSGQGCAWGGGASAPPRGGRPWPCAPELKVGKNLLSFPARAKHCQPGSFGGAGTKGCGAVYIALRPQWELRGGRRGPSAGQCERECAHAERSSALASHPALGTRRAWNRDQA